ncbi:hypothetical protein [Hyalangium gracile]|uniref:hypothetical protein n=1 Tax=Hyalangium gracile TaxID=394092 RepID=UPI001CCC3548|nr:hypothetical protein [Hyalangium gracile]
MRKVMLTVVGLVGASLLLCGSVELLAQTDTTTEVGTTVGRDATDTRLQGPSGGTRAGTTGTSDTSDPGTVGTGGAGTASGTGTAATGTAQTTGGAGPGVAELPLSVMQLQQEVAQVRQDVAQLREQLESMNQNMGVGGSGQAGTSDTQAPAASGTTPQDMVRTPPDEPLRAGTAQETGARSTPDTGEAVVNAIYTGTVRSVANGRLVLLDDAGQSFTVELGQRTRILRNGQRISAQDLKQGTRVRATVDMLAGHNQAMEVTTLPAR